MHRLAVGMAVLCLGLCAFSVGAADEKAKDTPKAAKTRALLKKPVTLSYKMEFLKDILDDIQDQVKGVKFMVDTKGGVSRNKRMTIMCKKLPLDEALDKMLGKEDLGYYVISKTGNAYDGLLFITMGKDRGYPSKKD